MTAHTHLMTDADRADMDRAVALRDEGRALRLRVQKRLRQRAWRIKHGGKA